jgi:hypothetical protein
MAVFTGPGSAASPSITFSADTNTGVFNPGADQVAVATNGVQRLTTSTAAVTSTLPILHPLGTAGAPSITFTNDLNTGFYSPAADTIAVATGGTQQMLITSDRFIRLLSGTGGIQFRGDTSQLNALDDYEEGNWTPTITSSSGSFDSITYALQRGGYAKIGAFVHVFFLIATSQVLIGDASGNLQITGLPFVNNWATSGASTNQVSSTSPGWSRTALATHPYAAMLVNLGGIARVLFATNGGTSQFSYAAPSALSLGTNSFHNQIQVSFTYMTNS